MCRSRRWVGLAFARAAAEVERAGVVGSGFLFCFWCLWGLVGFAVVVVAVAVVDLGWWWWRTGLWVGEERLGVGLGLSGEGVRGA